ncbi:XdhC family protein [bacterium]|nr:XdhC family protein [bacterium]
MQENWQQLINVFDSKQSYVLATIVATRGSTYRKTGTLMLISADGTCTGLLSGGCLEADISLHAMAVLKESKSKLLSYDLKADAELLWGLGLGCDGAIDILLQPLTVDNNFLSFDYLLKSLLQRKSGFYCQLINDDVISQATFIEAEIGNKDELNNQLAEQSQHWKSETEILITPVLPPVALLICGAGPDVLPVVTMANQLGWQVSLWDHRPAYLNQKEFSDCVDRKKIRPEHIKNGEMVNFDGVIVMSHNLTSDGLFLKQALSDTVDYIGLLGPAGRRDKLLNALELTASDVKNQVFGPVGLDIGGRSPQSIALSICAEVQQHMSHRYQGADHKPWLMK